MANIYRLGDLSATVLEPAVGNCSGPCFSLDGRTFYFADSPRRQIYAYDYDTATGAIANRRLFADTNNFGSPPDVDNRLRRLSLVGVVTGGRIVRFGPAGKAERTIEMPGRHPINVAFADPRSMSSM